MTTLNNTSQERMSNSELLMLLDPMTDRHDQKLALHTVSKLEATHSNFPGSVGFFYRNHPNLLRITRIRSNGRGKNVAKDDQTNLQKGQS